METNKTTTVTMTDWELRRYKAWKEREGDREVEEQRRADLKAYRELVDETLATLVPRLAALSGEMRQAKADAIDTLRRLLELKRDIIGLKEGGQYSHTFTSSDGAYRLKLGTYTTDGYADTVNEGIEMVQDYIQSLASDDASASLVAMVMRLLSKDSAGNLKASRVVQLRKIAEDSGAEELLRGVKLIEDSYMPQVSRIFISVEKQGKTGGWVKIPLNITDVTTDRDSDAAKLINGDSTAEAQAKAQPEP